MAVWAIAWAGSKPFASLVDGWLGSSIGPQWTGLLLATPALLPIVVLMVAPSIWLARSHDSLSGAAVTAASGS
jgi:hypothetical protein